MAVIQVSAGKTLLESYIKTPPVGLCELVWNAFDEDATTVKITVERNGLGGVEQVSVEDDGNGMNLERAQKAFATVGDSWKLMPGSVSPGGRPVHGRHGKGRYAAFSIGNSVRWISTSTAIEGAALTTVKAVGKREELDRFDVDEIPLEGSRTGTRVVIGVVTPEAVSALDDPAGLRQRLLTEFALHLERHRDFAIEFLGEALDPSQVIAARVEMNVPEPEGIEGPITLTIIEWTLDDVERRLYLCLPDGTIVGETQPGIQAPGAEFTAYVAWNGFSRETYTLEGDTETPTARVLAAARSALRAHLNEALRKREAEVVRRWQQEGVYPYKDEPVTEVEKATRDTFNLVAMATSRTVDEAKSRSSKALALSLLKETFEHDPEALLPILQQFSKLPAARIEELKDILERTTLTQLITLGTAVGSRIDFLHGLNALLFDRSTRRRLLERKQLHRILAHETWIFGEEWSLTGDDER